MEVLDVIDLHNCVVKDENGIVMARLYEYGGSILVRPSGACSIGMYFYILNYLHNLGIDAR